MGTFFELGKDKAAKGEGLAPPSKKKSQNCCQQCRSDSYETPAPSSLTLKEPITTAAYNIHKYFFIVFQRKIRVDVSSESSAKQRIHMKNQALFSSKDECKKLKCLIEISVWRFSG